MYLWHSCFYSPLSPLNAKGCHLFTFCFSEGGKFCGRIWVIHGRVKRVQYGILGNIGSQICSSAENCNHRSSFTKRCRTCEVSTQAWQSFGNLGHPVLSREGVTHLGGDKRV
ncbi:hypothetical protein SLE2022_144530 [Rubroshorea leprosula]